MIIEIAIGFAIAALILLMMYLLWNRSQGAATCRKTIENGKSRINIRANKNLRRVTVKENIKGEKVALSRENIKKGEETEFSYPFSMGTAKVTIEDEKGDCELEVKVS